MGPECGMNGADGTGSFDGVKSAIQSKPPPTRSTGNASSRHPEAD